VRVVTLSDGRRLRVDAEQIARHTLAPGEEIDNTVAARLEARDLYLRARESAVRLLAVRSRSTAELRARLRQKRVPDPQIRAVLHDLTAAGYLDDLAFARTWIAGRMASRLLGVRRLRWELREKGVPSSLVDQAMHELAEGEGVAAAEERGARALVMRRLLAYRGLPPDRRARRIAGLLQRRGFAPSTISRILRTLGSPDLWETVDA
jgi:regulatory protein